MKNGTPSKSLTVVDSTGSMISDGGDFEDAGTEYFPIANAEDSARARNISPLVSPALIFVAVSVACAVAAVAAGSYAFRLTRQKVAHEAINNVQDILKICQERVHQLEDDLHLLPTLLSPST